ncbi:MAG: cell division transport system permease protein [Halieaceae bacterium]
MAAVMTWLVIGIAIALPSGLWVLLDNLGQFSERLQSPAQLSVFLTPDTELAEAQTLAVLLRARADVSVVRLVDRETALTEFVERSGMVDLAASLPDNPLPHLLLVTPRDEGEDAVLALRDAMVEESAVGEVLIDMLWLQRLQSIMLLGQRAVELLAGLLLAAVVLVLGNTIRMAIENRRDEIVIVKLVGGSDAFVRRPLLYTGLWFGLGGGVVAALLMALASVLLAGPIAALARTYGSDFVLRGLGVVDSLQLVLLGAALGLAGAWTAVARHLRAIEPR